MSSVLARYLCRHCSFSFNHFSFANRASAFSYNINRVVSAYSSWKRTELPDTLSDVEEYVARDFSYPDLKSKLDQDGHLPAVTTQTALLGISTVDGILETISSSHESDSLWNDELNLYFGALIRMINTPRKPVWCKDESAEDFDIAKLHDNPYFQILIKKALLATPTLPTYHLSQFFAAFVKLHIPPLSNTMLILIACIQNRINEFFPDEALTCLQSIAIIEKRGVSCIGHLRDGFLMHLENQLLDPPTFARILGSMPISLRLSLLRHDLSKDLISFILRSVMDTAQSDPERCLRSRKDAEVLLKFLWKSHSPKKYLLRVVQTYFSERPHELSEQYREMLTIVRDRFRNADKPLH